MLQKTRPFAALAAAAALIAALAGGARAEGLSFAPALRDVATVVPASTTALRLLDMRALPEITYANGDRAQYLDICFLCEADDSQRPFPADGENTEALWCPVEDLPPMNDRFREQLALALEDRAETRFRR